MISLQWSLIHNSFEGWDRHYHLYKSESDNDTSE